MGNSVAPWRFVVFGISLLIVGIGFSLVIHPWQKAIMLAFDVSASFFLVLIWSVISDGSADSIKRHAAENDANRVLLLALSAVIAGVLLVTVAMELTMSKHPPAVLIVVTIILAWFFSNIIYALHYAHLFYGAALSGSGLIFPGEKKPDYWDFMYFSFTLGMTFQTSDVSISDAKMRRVVTAQCIAAFFFNIGVLAFTINILGS